MMCNDVQLHNITRYHIWLYLSLASFHFSVISSIMSWQPQQFMIEIMEILGPNLPVKARPSFDRVEAWSIAIFFYYASFNVVWIQSSTPFCRLFLSMFRAKMMNFDSFLSFMVLMVRLHSLIPETINFLAFSGVLIFLIACLYANLLITLRTISQSSQLGQLVTHSLKQNPLQSLPVNLPILSQVITCVNYAYFEFSFQFPSTFLSFTSIFFSFTPTFSIFSFSSFQSQLSVRNSYSVIA